MAFLKIRTMYVIGNANGKQYPRSHPWHEQQLTDYLKATVVELLIFGTAEPATAIMAASIPILRVLIQRNPSSKPSEFVDLGNHSNQSKSVSMPLTRLDSTNDTEGKPNPHDSWHEFSSTAGQSRVCQHTSDYGKNCISCQTVV
jgi:hypothetical protein